MKTRTKQQHDAARADHNGFSLISSEKLLRIHAAMVKCRMVAERARILFEPGRLTGFGDLAAGEEAIQVGVTLDLQPEDAVFPSHRGFIAHLMQGEPVDTVFSRLLAQTASLPPAALLHLAAGAALASKTKRKGKIVVLFGGGDAASSGLWAEALNLACLHRLPILFVRQAGFADDSAVRNSPAATSAKAPQAVSCSLPAITVDGSDAVAVYRVATEAIAHARKGNGPTLIECAGSTWPAHPRMEAAHAPGPEEPQGHMASDPILKMENYLLRKGLTRAGQFSEGQFSDDLKPDSIAGFARELDAVLEAAAGVPNFR